MRPMSTNVPDCTHRRNQDQTLTSVCNRCRLTIGCAARTMDLQDLEFRHVCQPVERRKVVRVAHQIYHRDHLHDGEPAPAPPIPNYARRRDHKFRESNS